MRCHLCKTADPIGGLKDWAQKGYPTVQVCTNTFACTEAMMTPPRGESLAEAVARAALCPTCGQPGVKQGLGEITYHPGGGVAFASLRTSVHWCPDCGTWFAREEKV